MEQVFDELVGQLSSEERRALLEQIQSTYADTSEPIYELTYEQPNIERVYNQLSFFEKLVIFLKMLFFSKDRLSVVEDLVFKRMYREVSDSAPGMIEPDGRRILAPFFLRIEELRRKAAVFIPAFKALSEKGRADFYAFLADMEIPDLSSRIIEECSPGAVSRRRGTVEEGILKAEVEMQLDQLLDELDPVERQNMYYHAKTLSCLREFALFPFERILSKQDSAKNDSALADELEKPLLELINVLHSLEYRPKVVFLEGLLLFSQVDYMHDADYRLEDEMKKWMENVKDSLSFIRTFLDQVPLIKIHILISRDLNFIPGNVASGEDWFSLYRNFWKNRLNNEVKKFIISCRKKETLEQAARIIHKDSIVSAAYYSKASIGADVKYEKSLGFLNEFIRRNFALSMYSQLKRVLIDGEFYKEQNSLDFSEAFSACNELESRIDSFLASIAPGSSWSEEMERIRKEPVPEALRKKKAAHHASKAEKTAGEIIKDAHSSFHLLVQVVNGILYGEKGGRFDTLSNIGYMGGRDNQGFLKKLAHVLDGLNSFYAVYSDLINLEENIVNNNE